MPRNEQTGKPENESPLLVLPGLIDCHVHFRDPASTSSAQAAEDMESGARAALAGGITTVCDMPNTEPPTCTEIALKEKVTRWKKTRDQRSEIRNLDMRFFFGMTTGEHLAELEKVMKNEGLRRCVPGVKLYLGHSTGNQMAEKGIVEEVFQVCSRLGLPVVCHCEDEEVIQRNMQEVSGQKSEISKHSEIRSVEAAVKATTFAIALAKKHGTHLHVAHVSTADELTLIRKAKEEGIPVTCEVAPHHLFLSVDDYETLGTLAKMNPPLRTHEHVEALWEGIADRTVDCVASDHAPHTLDEKHSPPLEAPSGVPGVETMLPLLLSCATGDGPLDAKGHSRLPITGKKLQFSDILRLLFTRPNEIFSLGLPAEASAKVGEPVPPPDKPPFTLVNPKETWVIQGKELHSKCGWTPYEGWTVQGKIIVKQG